MELDEAKGLPTVFPRERVLETVGAIRFRRRNLCSRLLLQLQGLNLSLFN